ncbi:VOC family protein [Tsukamurella tyrosinosolvens]|uniref:VOC family protein n=1 Tax=Tsukamurella tyrosinosolvens TaxID=57704 RepID=UPI000C7F0983|nr:VOC family protein [Tsukamurella tyrosinosolvens]AUN41864.1 hypothetical protein ASU32_19195 [Tsukamurella tyrosinosolvens]
MQISTFLWFDSGAEVAAELYTSLFADSRIHEIHQEPNGQVATVEFTIEGQRCIAYNGGPGRGIADAAFSMHVECETQDDIDRVWEALAHGGIEGAGGYVIDRFGVPWQVLPRVLPELLRSGDTAAARVLSLVHTMAKIDIQELLDAHA